MRNILDGIRVLELSRVLAGPLCAMQLAEFGAEIIKVEHPDGGDDTRGWGPPFHPRTGNSAYFESVNRGKKSVAADFSRDGGGVCKLAARSDVVVENFLPGALKKYRLDYDSVRRENPNVVYCSITGYGQTGEWSGRRGYDFIIQGESGLMALGGAADGEAYKTGVAVCDILAGLHAAQAILAALFRRAGDQKGAHIDISLFDCAVAALVNVAQASLQTGEPAKRFGNHHPHIVPYGAFFAADGAFNIAAGNDRQFAALCEVLQKPQWAKAEEFCDNPRRVANRDKLVAMLNAELRRKPADEWLAGLRARGVPAGKVLNVAETLALPHAKQRALWREQDGVKLMRAPARFCGEESPAPSPPPTLGAHTDSVLRDIAGLSANAAAELRRRNIIGGETQ